MQVLPALQFSLLFLFKLCNLLLLCWSWMHGSTLCIATCTKTSFCTVISILNIIGWLSLMPLGPFTITLWKVSYWTQLVVPSLSSFREWLHVLLFSSSVSLWSKLLMIIVDFGCRVISSIYFSKTILRTMTFIINSKVQNSTILSHSFQSGTNCSELMCPTDLWSDLKGVLRQGW